MKNSIDRSQSYIDSTIVAEMMVKFDDDFKEIYPPHIIKQIGVGPMHTFIGYCIQNGYLEIELDEL